MTPARRAASFAARIAVAWFGILVAACGVSGTLGASSLGGGGGSSAPASPTARVTAPKSEAQVMGFVAITYELRDPEGPGGRRRVSVRPQYRLPPTPPVFPPWNDMTEAADPASEGTAHLDLGEHTFVWNSLVDAVPGAADVEILKLEIRIVATWEGPAAGRRRFRSAVKPVRLDTRRAGTYYPTPGGAGSDVVVTPVDIGLDVNGDALVADDGANIVDRIDGNGRIARVLGIGVPGEKVEDGRNLGAVALPPLRSFDRDSAGNLYTDHGDRVVVTNRGATDLVFGLVDGDDADMAADTVVAAPQTVVTARIPGLSDSRALRFHPSGALLLTSRLPDGTWEILAVNPADPGDPSSLAIDLAGVTLSPGTTARIAGGGADESDGADALSARLDDVGSIGIGPAGEIYWTESSRGEVRVLNPTDAPVTLADRVVAPSTVDTVAGAVGGVGSARRTALLSPQGVAVSATGLLFVAERGNKQVRVINLSDFTQPFNDLEELAPGDIEVAVGSGSLTPPTRARYIQLLDPRAVAVDPAGNVLVADGDRVVVANGSDETVTLHGHILAPYLTETIYVSTGRAGIPFDRPRAVGLRSQLGGDASIVYLTDATSVRVLNLDSGPVSVRGVEVGAGETVTLAGGAVRAFAGDGGPAENASFDTPSAIAAQGPDRLWVADTGNDRIRLVHVGDPTTSPPIVAAGVTVAAGRVDTAVGGATGPVAADGDGLAPRDCSLAGPLGVCTTESGLLLVADTGHHRIRAVNLGDAEADVAGVVVPPSTVMTIVGTGSPGFTPDGPGPWAVDTPCALAADRNLIYFAESGNSRIRVLNVTDDVVRVAGIDVPPHEVATVVGSGLRGNSGDAGPTPAASIDSPRALFVQTAVGVGRVLVFSDGPHHVLRIVNLTDGGLLLRTKDDNTIERTLAAGTIFTLAGGPNDFGRPNAPGFAGDGGLPADMRFDEPWGVVFAARPSNCLSQCVIADQGNDRIRGFGAPRVRFCAEAP